MITKRGTLLAGAVLGGALLLGTAGLALAQDPTSSPTASPSAGTYGGMMGGSSMMGGSGLMGELTADQLSQMNALHDQMLKTGTCDIAAMQQFHTQVDANR